MIAAGAAIHFAQHYDLKESQSIKLMIEMQSETEDADSVHER